MSDTTGIPNDFNSGPGQTTSGSQLGQSWGGTPQTRPPYCHYPFNYCPCCGRPNTAGYFGPFSVSASGGIIPGAQCSSKQ